jgi:hypothetical protein
MTIFLETPVKHGIITQEFVLESMSKYVAIDL